MKIIGYITIPNPKDKKFNTLMFLHDTLQCPYGRKNMRESLELVGKHSKASMIPMNIKVSVSLDLTKEIFDYHLEDTIELVGFKK